MKRECGFPPVYQEESELLILGSFPSVKSREEGFYYANPHNRFWRVIASFFEEDVPNDTEKRRDFVLRHNIALWDVVSSCEIEGSKDESIRKEQLSDLEGLLHRTHIRAIFCNGATSYRLLQKSSPALLPITRRMPSTSPRNAGCRELVFIWHSALAEIFPRGEEGQFVE